VARQYGLFNPGILQASRAPPRRRCGLVR
jgi:hypothetical protein